MKTDLSLAILLAAAFAAPAPAADRPGADARPADGVNFSDPVFQDFIETGDGYLRSSNTMQVRTDFSDLRDAPISAAPAVKVPPPVSRLAAPKALPEDRPGLPSLPQGHYKVTFAGEAGPVGSYVRPLDSGSGRYAREYVLLGVEIKGDSYDALLPKLEAAGLRFAGEKNSYSSKNKKTVILGWAPLSSMARLARVPGVASVAVEKKGAGVPLKARVRFTLKVPYQNKPAVFVPDFIKRLTEEDGFAAESWFRLPRKDSESRFSVFDVVGTLPVDSIGELSRSPFVASVEFNDASL